MDVDVKLSRFPAQYDEDPAAASAVGATVVDATSDPAVTVDPAAVTASAAAVDVVVDFAVDFFGEMALESTSSASTIFSK